LLVIQGRGTAGDKKSIHPGKRPSANAAHGGNTKQTAVAVAVAVAAVMAKKLLPRNGANGNTDDAYVCL